MSAQPGSEFWNPKNETLPRDQLDALRLEKLRKLCEWAHERSPFHRRRFDAAGFDVSQLKTLDDVRRIPCMTREEWMEAQEAQPLFGDILALPQEQALRYHYTSGTSGRTPLRVLDTIRDWQWGSEMWAYGFWGFGVRPADIVMFAFSYGSFIGFWGAHYACEKIGALVVPSGNMTTEARVRLILDIGATTVCATPTYVLRMAQVANELGIDLASESQVNKVIVSGEPSGSIPAVKRMMEQAWGAPVADTAGMSEIGTIFMFECAKQPGGAHIIEDHFIEEVLTPDGDEPAAYGEQGERVVTSFGRSIIPLIRYRSQDLVVKVPADHCSCGRSFDIYDGGLRGRVDDMKLVRGTNVYPRAIESIVREHDSIDEFQILLTREEGIRDEITVRVELKAGRDDDWNELESALGDELADAHEGLRFNIERAEPDALPRFELKAKRVVDQRGE